MAILLYDLAARDDAVRFSPYCWRVRMALAHKGLEVRTVPWRFVEKERLGFARTDRVPVIVDGERTVVDSMAIADYLDARYPSRPLFDSPQARAHATLIRHWVEQVVFPGVTRQVVADLVSNLHPMDVEYFRKSREARFGMTLEAFCADRDERLPVFRASLEPLRLTVAAQPFLGGESPGFADYIPFAALQWARCGAGRVLVEPDDPVGAWFERMLDLYDGLGATARCAA